MKFVWLLLALILNQSALLSAQVVSNTPRMVSGCIDNSGGLRRINVTWTFDENFDVEQITAVRITQLTDENPFVELYPGNFTDEEYNIDIDYTQYAKNVPVFISDLEFDIRVSVVINRALSPWSSAVTLTLCNAPAFVPADTTSSSTNTPPTDGNTSNASSDGGNDDFPVLAVVIAVAIVCVVLFTIIVILIVVIIKIRRQSAEKGDHHIKPMQHGSLLFRKQAKNAVYIETVSQAESQSSNSPSCDGFTEKLNKAVLPGMSDDTSNENDSDEHKYDVPANKLKAPNGYDQVDFLYEKPDHPLQQSFTGTSKPDESSQQQHQKYHYLVHSSSRDKLDQDCPELPPVHAFLYNQLSNNSGSDAPVASSQPTAENQTSLEKNSEVYYSVPQLNHPLNPEPTVTIEKWSNSYDHLTMKQ